MKIDIKDAGAGLIFAGFGAFFCINAWLNFDTGTATRIGPAVFPMMLGTVLVGLGIAVAARSFGVTSSIGSVSWRGICFTTLSVVSFGISVEALGFVLALAIAVALSAFASARMTFRIAVLLTLGLTLFCVLIFKFGLELPLEPFGTVFH